MSRDPQREDSRAFRRGEDVNEQSTDRIERFRSGPCSRCSRNSDELVAITTVVNGIEQKEWVCPSCERETREDEKPAKTKVRSDGGTPTDGTWRCWCEHEDCDWTRSGEEATREIAQKASSAAMAGHGIAEGHHETFRSVDTDT